MSDYNRYKRATSINSSNNVGDGVKTYDRGPRERLRIGESKNNYKSSREGRFTRNSIVVFTSFGIIILVFIAFFIIMLLR